jgi:hypothetical protein
MAEGHIVGSWNTVAVGEHCDVEVFGATLWLIEANLGMDDSG